MAKTKVTILFLLLSLLEARQDDQEGEIEVVQEEDQVEVVHQDDEQLQHN